MVKNQSLGTNLKEEALSIQEEKEGKIILFIGILGFIFVPIFKTFTHLPPYMCIFFVFVVALEESFEAVFSLAAGAGELP